MTDRQRRDVMQVAVGDLEAARKLEAILEDTIQTLSHRAVQNTNLIVSTGPLSPLTSIQNIQSHISMTAVVRDAVKAGRRFERALIAIGQAPVPPPLGHPPATTPEDPKHDEEATTKPMRRSRDGHFSPVKLPDLGDQ